MNSTLPAWQATADVVVVGTGVAGLTCALDAAPGLRVLVVTKGAADEANTSWAQGGVAVVRDERDPGDSVAAHVQDTLVAGPGTQDQFNGRRVAQAGPGDQGVLHMGSHAVPGVALVAHDGDATLRP